MILNPKKLPNYPILLFYLLNSKVLLFNRNCNENAIVSQCMQDMVFNNKYAINVNVTAITNLVQNLQSTRKCNQSSQRLSHDHHTVRLQDGFADVHDVYLMKFPPFLAGWRQHIQNSGILMNDVGCSVSSSLFSRFRTNAILTNLICFVQVSRLTCYIT